MHSGNTRNIEVSITEGMLIDHALTFLYGSGILHDADNDREDILSSNLERLEDGSFKLHVKFKKELEVRTTKLNGKGERL